MLVPLLGFERIVAPEVVSGIGHLDLDGQKFLEKGSLAIEVCLIRAKRDIQRSAQEAPVKWHKLYNVTHHYYLVLQNYYGLTQVDIGAVRRGTLYIKCADRLLPKTNATISRIWFAINPQIPIILNALSEIFKGPF